MNLSTHLSNQRTYLSMMRTGFAISGVAAKTGLHYVSAFGFLLMLYALLQYKTIELEKYDRTFPAGMFTVAAIVTIYFQFYASKKK